ncbi:MAG: YdeI/OmpD-associated family protein [Dokdonella sp.]|uniref:YdeI/OmpD-associated family protein n=1 Tax=Dokdonella sp. TaxID=2291710 RepID=UPI003266FFE6
MAVSRRIIRFNATLLRPANVPGALWLFVLVPKASSGKLPTRSMVTVDGTFSGHPFQASLEPDGQGGHWLKVTKAMCEAANVAVGDTIALSMTPVAKEPEPQVPVDLRCALAAHPGAKAQWLAITAVARRDCIQWISSGKKAETRGKRIATACSMLAAGKRRICCFDRSGMYSNSMTAPTAAE